MKGKKDVRDSLTFVVGAELIQAKLTAQYLGVIILRNKSLEPHVNLLHTKICRVVGLMRGVRGSSAGMQFNEAARYYKGVFQPTILYAVATRWAKPFKKIRDMVQYLQRAALIPSTRAYLTSTTAALQVIAGIEPVDQDERVAVSKLNWAQRTLAEVRPQLQRKMNSNQK
ncbi:Retrotransposon protein [Nesidiocoris tenuis]|uniref:Retrotransposon protein n=1 Tax=Nesidiocoris tenuis TaxID=355587 RepID=A0ABN7ACK5_9HEMI|nr:Retrotransposon protein [Nesidiocoris tenuis]